MINRLNYCIFKFNFEESIFIKNILIINSKCFTNKSYRNTIDRSYRRGLSLTDFMAYRFAHIDHKSANHENISLGCGLNRF